MRVLVVAVLLAGSVGGGAAGAADPSDRVAATGIPPGLVDGEAAHRLVAAGVRVVDVRTASEFDAGHVPGAVNIPYDEVLDRRGEIGPPSTPVLVYCETGRRSAIAAATLQDQGFTRVWDLQRYDRWVAAGQAPEAN